jgi:hypothetical protein
VSSASSGILLCGCAVLVVLLAWPTSRWVSTAADLVHVPRLILLTLANAVVLVSAYLAMASLVWGFADASMKQPIDLGAFDLEPSQGRTWRIAHLSDLHMVGERYGFASRAVAAARAAMTASHKSWLVSKPSILPIHWI